MVDEIYFFDSYAIIELIRGNSAYKPYRESRMATTALNLIEVHYILLREHGQQTASAFFKALLPAIVVFEDFIPAANQLRLKLRKRNVSAADCIGYTVAQAAGLKFLTGDKEFESMECVEYVK